METSSGFEEVKSLRSPRILQNGVFAHHNPDGPTGGLDGLGGPPGCLLSCSHSACLPEISKSGSGSHAPPVPVPSLWPVHVPEDILKSTDRNSGTPQGKGVASVPFPGRYPVVSLQSSTTSGAQRGSPVYPEEVWLVGEFRKVS